MGGFAFLFGLDLLEIRVKAIEALFPELAVVVNKGGNFDQRGSFEVARPPLGLPGAPDKSGSLKYFEVFGDGRKGHVKGLGEFGNRSFARSQPG